MALDLTPQGLFDEVRQAKEHREKFLGSDYSDAIERYVGPGYRRGGDSDTDFDNHAYKWLSLFLPMLASGNPRVRAKTPRQGTAAQLCKAVELAVNRNFELTNAKKTIEQLATDWAFKYAVSFTAPRPVMGMLEREDPPYRPVTTRLSLLDYVWDPVSIQHAECRFQAHRIIRDRDSLVREAKEMPNRGWDLDAVSALSGRPDRERRGEKLDHTPDRDEVEIWEVWVPEALLDDAKDEAGRKFKPRPERGYHGTYYTVSRDAGVFLRDPRPFWGPRDGPYTFNGYLYVPDRVVPLSPLSATSAQAELHNSVWSAAVQAIRSYKNGIAVSSGAAADLAEKLREFEDLDVFEVESHDDIDKVVRDIEKGGITAQHMSMLQLLRFNLEQASGLTEAAQGQSAGGTTATADSIAQMASNRRMGYMTEKFITGMVKPIAHKEAWYSAMHPKARTPLGQDGEGVFRDDLTGEPIEMPILIGGSKDAELLEDMDIEIEPISMRSTSEMLEAEISARQDQWVAQFGPMIPQMPWIEWDQIIARKAEQWRDPSWARVINIPKAMAFGAAMMRMNLQGVQGGGIQVPQPRLGIDTKPAISVKSSESPAGFSKNARPQQGPQQHKAPREPGASSATKQPSTSGA